MLYTKKVFITMDLIQPQDEKPYSWHLKTTNRSEQWLAYACSFRQFFLGNFQMFSPDGYQRQILF